MKEESFTSWVNTNSGELLKTLKEMDSQAVQGWSASC